MSTRAVAVRFDERLLEQVKSFAQTRGMSTSAVVQTLVGEGIRSREIPGIQFRQGPAGVRPSVAGGLDVWEVISQIRDLAEPSGSPAGLAGQLGLRERDVAIALEYYGRYPEEINAWIDANEREATVARAAWAKRKALLK
ncbi:MAG: hypothetical protein LBG11_09740 [Bifidobacteriaceae bacterium]|nr:hypothetical protein [Bifidobacteriaceae bacterium]